MGTDGGKVTEKGKKKKAKDAKKKDDNEKESCDDKNEEEGVMQRLKGRLSMRGKKKDKMEKSSDQQKECNGTSEDANKNEKAEKKESRESLRTLGSRQDLTQVEERVREAVGKNLSRQVSLRRGAGGSTSIPITLSVSLQELRANQ